MMILKEETETSWDTNSQSEDEVPDTRWSDLRICSPVMLKRFKHWGTLNDSKYAARLVEYEICLFISILRTQERSSCHSSGILLKTDTTGGKGNQGNSNSQAIHRDGRIPYLLRILSETCCFLRRNRMWIFRKPSNKYLASVNYTE